MSSAISSDLDHLLHFITHMLLHVWYKRYLYYSTSSLTNQIAPFEGNNVGYSLLQHTLWQSIMMPGNNFALFECRACVHAAQYSQWLSSRDRYWWQRRTISQLLHYTTWAIADIIDLGKVWLPLNGLGLRPQPLLRQPFIALVWVQ